MTNSQKYLCREYAKNSNFSAKEIAELVGCCVGTAREYIKIFRKSEHFADVSKKIEQKD